MDITNLRYEAGELKKRVIDAHSAIITKVSQINTPTGVIAETLIPVINDLDEIIKLAQLNAEYYTELAASATAQRDSFRTLIGSIEDVYKSLPEMSTYVGKCIECGAKLYTNSAYMEEEPGNFICSTCWEDVTHVDQSEKYS